MEVLVHMTGNRSKTASNRPRASIKRTALITLIILCGVLITGFLAEQVLSYRDRQRYTPPGELVEVGDRTVHWIDMGEGTPAVLLESGLPGSSLDWMQVQAEISEFTRVIAYDRAGYGWSDPGTAPRTAEQIALEVQQLLESEQVSGPYILVAHSFGGIYSRFLAQELDGQLAGIVLVDTTPEDYSSRLPAGFLSQEKSMEQLMFWGQYLAYFGIPRIIGYSLTPTYCVPEEMTAMAVSTGYRPVAFRTLQGEFAARSASIAALEEKDQLLNVPLTVIARSGRVSPAVTDEEAIREQEEVERIWQELQMELSMLSLNGKFVRADKSGHFIQCEQPDLVVQAVREMVLNR